MKLLGILVVIAQASWSQCGTELTEKERDNCKVRNISFFFLTLNNVRFQGIFGDKWEPSGCNPETHNCNLGDDKCSYNCVRKDQGKFQGFYMDSGFIVLLFI